MLMFNGKICEIFAYRFMHYGCDVMCLKHILQCSSGILSMLIKLFIQLDLRFTVHINFLAISVEILAVISTCKCLKYLFQY